MGSTTQLIYKINCIKRVIETRGKNLIERISLPELEFNQEWILQFPVVFKGPWSLLIM